jgi:DNA (cytosine-5)-methyltransferase 1
MIHLDLFSGIGGFSQGLKQAGFDITKHYYAEVDKHAQAIYRHRFQNAEPVGDVRHVRGSELGKVNIITFGSPCQDFSLAGKRRGMDGERSSLITEAIRLIDECRPDFFIWENVKGTFSSNNGADFFAILQAFANIGGYRCEWQLLNTSWVLPQNRERIYLVGRIADRCAGQVFPIAETNQIAEKKRKRFCRKVRADKNRANCLTSRMHKMGRTDNYVQVGDYRHDEGLRWRQDSNSPTMPARARQDGSGQPIVSYAMGGSKKGRSCINAQRVPEIGNEQESIRRLTEIECERLQGFHDNWTQYGNYDGEVKEVSGSQRYKCLGNAVTVDIVQMVGESVRRGFKS